MMNLYSRTLRVAALAMLIVYLGCNVMSRVASPAYWLAHPEGVVASRSNTVVAYDLDALEDWLDTRPDTVDKQVAFVSSIRDSDGPPQPLQVLAAQSMSLLASHNINCINCVSSPTLLDFRWFSSQATAASARVDYQLRIGPMSQRCVDGFVPRFVSENLAFFERANSTNNDSCLQAN